MKKMDSLVIWAHSYCRSTLAFYEHLAKSLDMKLTIYTWYGDLELRTKTGFSNSEFDYLEIEQVNDYEKASFLLEKNNAYHIFATYQSSTLHRKLIKQLILKGRHYGIISEAPCNMKPYPMHMLKYIYQCYILPIMLRSVIKNADFIINCSGYYESALTSIGWKEKQIISCGYYPPRIPESRLVERNIKNYEDFKILLTGLHEWHRSPWILLEALNELKKEGYNPKCYITQKGPYWSKLKQYANKKGLKNVEFLGFVEINKLIDLYETCSVYIGTGNYEPWGMRLNDVLLCGAPLIVNRGMGGVKMVDDFECGFSFKRNDYKGLAKAIKTMMTDSKNYLRVAKNAYRAAHAIEPMSVAPFIAKQVKNKINI